MKKIFFAILVLIALTSVCFGQKIYVAPETPFGHFIFERDTMYTTDSLMFYAPYDMIVLSLQAVATAADTGAASPAMVLTLKLKSSGSAIATATMTAGSTVAYGSPTTKALGKLSAGNYYTIKWTLGASDVISNVVFGFYYTR
jgi:hypothetical protein